MLVINEKDQKELLSMEEAIEAVSKALSEFSQRRAISPVRHAIPVSKSNGTSLFMPSLVEATGSLGIKFVSVFPGNKELGKKTIYGLMVLADVATGEPLAVMDASYLTVLRTGAASGLATKLLARKDAKIAAVIGTGAQSRGLIQAILAVRPVEELRLFNRSAQKALELANEIAEQYGKDRLFVRAVNSPEEAVKGADILVTATNSAAPVFPGECVDQGIHVNAVGSFRPEMQELPSLLVAKADKVVVESKEAALEESGDLLVPIREGLFSADDIFAELGEIASGDKPGREREEEITVFKSVGLAAMDVVVAKAMYDKAVSAGVGQIVSW